MKKFRFWNKTNEGRNHAFIWTYDVGINLFPKVKKMLNGHTINIAPSAENGVKNVVVIPPLVSHQLDQDVKLNNWGLLE